MSYSEFQDDRLKEARQEMCDWRNKCDTYRRQRDELVEIARRAVDAWDSESGFAKSVDELEAAVKRIEQEDSQ